MWRHLLVLPAAQLAVLQCVQQVGRFLHTRRIFRLVLDANPGRPGGPAGLVWVKDRRQDVDPESPCGHCTVSVLSLHSLSLFLFVLSWWVSNTLASLTLRELEGRAEQVGPEERRSGDPLGSAVLTVFTTGIWYITGKL